MSITSKLKKLLELPPAESFQLVRRKLKKNLDTNISRFRDRVLSTYAPGKFPHGDINSHFTNFSVEEIDLPAEFLTEMYLNHRFNLLGSGWVKVEHGMDCRGVEGNKYDSGSSIEADLDGDWLEGRIHSPNLKESQTIWKNVDDDYEPIDWHRDFKSGFRWEENTWYRDIQYGQEHKPGVDVKVPWELARLQHLPQMAIFGLSEASNSHEENFVPPSAYKNEFRNQVLDFIATNPPRFGVNWASTMDVGIRAVNLLVTFDLFQQYSEPLDETFNTIFCQSMYEHGRFIINNLEWSPQLRGNHYLANIAGLLFISSYLPRTEEIDGWLAFSIKELIREVKNQFNSDGGNFEGSTCYHRLSSEMVVYSTALILGLSSNKLKALKEFSPPGISYGPEISLPEEEFPEFEPDRPRSLFPGWYPKILYRMAKFTISVSNPNGEVAQIGDNDSGRFLKLNPPMSGLSLESLRLKYSTFTTHEKIQDIENYYIENSLFHQELISAIDGILNIDLFEECQEQHSFCSNFISALADENYFEIQKDSINYSGNSSERIWHTHEEKFESAQQTKKYVIDIDSDDNDLQNSLQSIAFPETGFYSYQSDSFLLVIRCGQIGQNGNGGHDHNDQLAVSLWFDGEWLIRDPGTYLYTPVPEQRNAYRSITNHFSPYPLGQEPASLDEGLFTLGRGSKGRCLYFDSNRFVGCHDGFKETIYRLIDFFDGKLRIRDYFNGDSKLANVPLSSNTNQKWPTQIAFSPGYGLKTEKIKEN